MSSSSSSKFAKRDPQRRFLKGNYKPKIVKKKNSYWRPSQSVATAASASSSSSSYVTVDKDEVSNEMVTIPRSLLRQGGSRLKQAHMSLWSGMTQAVSSAATALNTNTNITFDSTTFPEWTSISALYDECQVHHINLHYIWFGSGAVATYGGLAAVAALGFDPQISTSSFNNVIEQEHHTGPLAVGFYNPGNGPDSVYVGGKFNVLHAKMPPPLDVITSTECPGSAWFTMETAAQPIISKLHLYAYAGPALAVTNCLYFLEVNCSFRMRV